MLWLWVREMLTTRPVTQGQGIVVLEYIHGRGIVTLKQRPEPWESDINLVSFLSAHRYVPAMLLFPELRLYRTSSQSRCSAWCRLFRDTVNRIDTCRKGHVFCTPTRAAPLPSQRLESLLTGMENISLITRWISSSIQVTYALVSCALVESPPLRSRLIGCPAGQRKAKVGRQLVSIGIAENRKDISYN